MTTQPFTRTISLQAPWDDEEFGHEDHIFIVNFHPGDRRCGRGRQHRNLTPASVARAQRLIAAYRFTFAMRPLPGNGENGVRRYGVTGELRSAAPVTVSEPVIINITGLFYAAVSVTAASTVEIRERQFGSQLMTGLLVGHSFYDLAYSKHLDGRPELLVLIEQARQQVQDAVAALQPQPTPPAAPRYTITPETCPETRRTEFALRIAASGELLSYHAKHEEAETAGQAWSAHQQRADALSPLDPADFVDCAALLPDVYAQKVGALSTTQRARFALALASYCAMPLTQVEATLAKMAAAADPVRRCARCEAQLFAADDQARGVCLVCFGREIFQRALARQNAALIEEEMPEPALASYCDCYQIGREQPRCLWLGHCQHEAVPWWRSPATYGNGRLHSQALDEFRGRCLDETRAGAADPWRGWDDGHAALQAWGF